MQILQHDASKLLLVQGPQQPSTNTDERVASIQHFFTNYPDLARDTNDVTARRMKEDANDDTLPQLWLQADSTFLQQHAPPSGWTYTRDRSHVLVMPGWCLFNLVHFAALKTSPAPSRPCDRAAS